MERNTVLLVNEHDEELMEMDKLDAHRQGLLHRAFSIFIFNNRGQLLLQQRAPHKYHGGSLWTNTCCSHPQLGECVVDSARQRLEFEMGLSADLEQIYFFIYHSPVENGLVEHELDHVLVGFSDISPQPNPDEVNDFKWMDPDEIEIWMLNRPQDFTVWFKEAFPVLMKTLSVKLLQ
ncbi:isopentenyl-diphosphate Delta-isomerase [Sphingobacterium yanglingense]|uniref:Isopentenyl-diphosphate delta-isomerase n=1 Tax=Sphingobacterium yanglingense TaxID=1437280 RepID=A0A4R6WP08_9SPHI|nr:isopentenyl-diphosphate Delta-isomerase [Sphingobacterium yanglingense]TDQ77955.1 isopentenyl-diphosphate delta-isomerase [Sphingobacterium yanglingense]